MGLCPLGPFAHWYYEFVATRLGEWPVACKIFLDADLPAHDVRTHFDEVRARAWYVGSSEGIAGRMG